MSTSAAIDQRVWNNCNVLREAGAEQLLARIQAVVQDTQATTQAIGQRQQRNGRKA